MADFIERRLQSNGQTVNFNIDRSQPFVETTINGQTARLYGSQAQLDTYQNQKPDGTPRLPVDPPTTVAEGLATRAASEAGASTSVTRGEDGAVQPSTPVNGVMGGSGRNLASVVPNPLEQFASMAPLWTMACLTPEQYNNPSIYRASTDALKHIVIAAGGRFDAQRQSTAYGTPEYFLNDFEMKAVINASAQTGNTNALSYKFTLYEPYSMGILLQSLQNAALQAGYTNYLEAPYVLRLDFMGYDDIGRLIKSVKPKFFVMKLKKVKFEVNEGGSTYDVEAFPYNHTGFLDTINTLFNDVTISATSEGTVREMLVSGEKSLCAYLNENEDLLVRQNRIKIPDEYVIQFPESSAEFYQGNTSSANSNAGATINPLAGAVRNVISGRASQQLTEFGQNTIGSSSFGFNAESGGNIPFAKEGDVVDPNTGVIVRDQMQIDISKREFMFSQGQPLTDIIVQTILSSNYAKAAMDPANLTPEGYIKWFRVDVQIEFLDFDETIGDYARRIVYRVVPFYVHHTVFTNPTSVPVGYNELEKKIAKHYQYIYTGQNVDVLDFSIKINNLFFSGTNPSVEAETADEQNQDQQGTVESAGLSTETPQGASPEAQISYTGRSRPRRDPALLNSRPNGAGYADTERKVAEMFHNAFVNSTTADLIQVDLEIMGDTYWMVESGFANHFVEPADPTDQIMSDGSVNYEGSDVFIYISFRTPIDINEGTGLYDFPPGTVSPFSGIYKVTRCLNKFSDGNFTQELRCIRMQGQALDYGGENLPSDTASAFTTAIGGAKDLTTSIADATTAIEQVASGDWITNIQNLVAQAEANGLTSTSNPTAAAAARIPERRIQSNGTIVNFNIDRKLPSRLVNIGGTETRVYGTETQLTERFGAAPAAAESGATTQVATSVDPNLTSGIS
jgi:hypothetical protein